MRRNYSLISLVLWLLFSVSCSFTTTMVNAEHADAVAAIDAYIAENDLSINRGSPEYESFLRDVVYWDQHPQLTNGEMGDLVREYAHAYLTKEHQELDELIDAPLVEGDERPVDASD